MRLNKHCTLLLLIAILLIPSQDLLAKKKKQVKEPTDRELWAGVLYRMAAPVLSNLSEGKLQQNMLNRSQSLIHGMGEKESNLYGVLWSINGWVSPWISLPDDDTAESIQWRGSLGENNCVNGL